MMKICWRKIPASRPKICGGGGNPGWHDYVAEATRSNHWRKKLWESGELSHHVYQNTYIKGSEFKHDDLRLRSILTTLLCNGYCVVFFFCL